MTIGTCFFAATIFSVVSNRVGGSCKGNALCLLLGLVCRDDFDGRVSNSSCRGALGALISESPLVRRHSLRGGEHDKKNNWHDAMRISNSVTPLIRSTLFIISSRLQKERVGKYVREVAAELSIMLLKALNRPSVLKMHQRVCDAS